MFKITDFRKIDGETHLTIVTDDLTTTLFLRLFKEAHKFAELYHYKVFTESGADTFQKERPEKMALARAARAEHLKSYRELNGTRYQRAQILKELRHAQGEDVTLDRIFTELTLAKKEEKENLIKQIGQLRANGHSLDFIADNLGVPKTTVSRYLKAYENGAAREEAVDVSPSNLVRLQSRKPETR